MTTTTIIAGIIAVLFLIHLLFLFLHAIRKDNYINQSVTFRSGKSVGAEGSNGGIMQDVNSMGETVYMVQKAPAPSVTSAFPEILICLKQLETGSEYRMNLKTQAIIGRYGGKADIQIADTMVSKKHCMIYRKGDKIFLEDLGSTNHTFVNGCLVQSPMVLCNGDVITIGHGNYQYNAYIK